MMRMVILALACVLVAAPPAMAKKRHARAHAVKTKKAKRAKALARTPSAPPPTRVAAVEQHPTRPAFSSPAPAPTPTPAVAPPAAAPSPPVEHGPMGPQASDDEVPGSRMKR